MDNLDIASLRKVPLIEIGADELGIIEAVDGGLKVEAASGRYCC